MPRLAPRVGVSILVALLFGPLSSTAHDSDDKSFEGEWSVIVAGHITWTGEDHRDCVQRATAASGQCVAMHHREGASNEYCPEVTPGLPAQCFTRAEGDPDRAEGDPDRGKGDPDRGKGDSDRGKDDSVRGKGDSDRGKDDSDRGKHDFDR